MKFFRFPRDKKEKIKMVHNDDLVEYLNSLGIYKDIQDRKINCKFCGIPITLENLQVLFPCGKKICIVCSDTKCMNKLQHE